MRRIRCSECKKNVLECYNGLCNSGSQEWKAGEKDSAKQMKNEKVRSTNKLPTEFVREHADCVQPKDCCEKSVWNQCKISVDRLSNKEGEYPS